MITAAWLDDPRTRAVTDMLARQGAAVLFVGGCVRDALLGREAPDVDIATDARPEAVLALARRAGLKAVPTGIAHGTVTVVSGGRPFEVTTFRRDVATDGRRAVVAFARDVREDAQRRDFTMNALYARPEGRVLDPTGQGLDDLARRRVRFVGTPARRIAEDYLRILRLFRFHAWYGDPAQGLDPEALEACARGLDGLARLSRERIGAEVARLLAAPDPAAAVAAMAATGALERVLPGARPEALPALVAAEAAAGAAPRWQRRLAALGPAPDWGERLRLSRADLKALAAIAAAGEDGSTPAALAFRHGADAARDAILLAAAAEGRAPPANLEAELARGAGARLPLRAADLPGLAGPALGQALRQAEAEWVASDLRLDRAGLLALLGRGD